jgi:ketosteroid isomerase-like protein
MSTQAHSMTTHEVANRLVSLCREGKIVEAQEELFADNVTATEPSAAMGPPVVEGKAAVIEKGKQFSAMIEEHHGGHISDPLVAGEWFSISWAMEVTMKGMGRQKMEEICVYHVKDGKIASEQYFFSMPGM